MWFHEIFDKNPWSSVEKDKFRPIWEIFREINKYLNSLAFGKRKNCFQYGNLLNHLVSNYLVVFTKLFCYLFIDVIFAQSGKTRKLSLKKYFVKSPT